ncbi:hypothetical protein RO3G_15406 [Rhizopus delemar RA 99-880]|uniref:DDE Tnp4 domain-containing protein n=1 Tax=Rhizopus delemar (strain RA 99-880 / ATCC MYA-4621 / FGSC 9543 / NRRL 43880) TaxID=246409 RepID=I1CQG5_RHIO9|nr:hypothetical protein RO3G_15406 [Rhizopus delemar RA 99-880]|eukprot:EIE90695.1 hypothetical protein RO3G_15406 [Rhizopus delemar RA 99-880]
MGFFKRKLEYHRYIPVFYFLNFIYGVSEYPGPYKEIDKGLLILYHMFWHSNFKRLRDCIAMDGGYNLYINKFKEDSLNAGKEFSDKNFVYPIRKENNKNLSASELQYNKRFGSFRSEIEDQFSVLASKFNRFNNNTSAMQTTDIKYYNLQFKVACLLKNMWKIVDKYNIEVQPHHMLWYTDGFEFPKNDRKIDIIVTDKIQFISDNEEDIEMEEVQIKRKKSKTPVVVIENIIK